MADTFRMLNILDLTNMTKIKRKFGDQTPEERAAGLAKAHEISAFLRGRIFFPSQDSEKTYFYLTFPAAQGFYKNYEENIIAETQFKSDPKKVAKDSVLIKVFSDGKYDVISVCAENIVYISGIGWMKAKDIQPGENILSYRDGVARPLVTISVSATNPQEYHLTKSENIGNYDPESGFLTYSYCKRTEQIIKEAAKSKNSISPENLQKMKDGRNKNKNK